MNSFLTIRAIIAVIIAGLFFTLPKSVFAQETAAVVTDGSWRYSYSEEDGWLDASFDDSSWENAASPSRGVCGSPLEYNHPEVKELGGFNIWSQDPAAFQTAYFRKTFTTPQDIPASYLATLIGGIDDDGDVYINRSGKNSPIFKGLP